jgi:hypothetical protein
MGVTSVVCSSEVIKRSCNWNLNEHYKNSTTVTRGEILLRSETESNVDSQFILQTSVWGHVERAPAPYIGSRNTREGFYTIQYHSRTCVTKYMELSTFEKPSVAQPFKNSPTFYGNRKFITVFKTAFHWLKLNGQQTLCPRRQYLLRITASEVLIASCKAGFCYSTPKMGAVLSSETSFDIYRTIWRYIQSHVSYFHFRSLPTKFVL